MKLECVDKRNPILVRVATVAEVEGNLIRIHFDGWDDCYDYWLDDDSTDIHPPGWCHKTGHPLSPPPGKLMLEFDRQMIHSFVNELMVYKVFPSSVVQNVQMKVLYYDVIELILYNSVF